jgi:hypothetical protein
MTRPGVGPGARRGIASEVDRGGEEESDARPRLRPGPGRPSRLAIGDDRYVRCRGPALPVAVGGRSGDERGDRGFGPPDVECTIPARRPAGSPEAVEVGRAIYFNIGPGGRPRLHPEARARRDPPAPLLNREIGMVRRPFGERHHPGSACWWRSGDWGLPRALVLFVHPAPRWSRVRRGRMGCREVGIQASALSTLTPPIGRIHVRHDASRRRHPCRDYQNHRAVWPAGGD